MGLLVRSAAPLLAVAVLLGVAGAQSQQDVPGAVPTSGANPPALWLQLNDPPSQAELREAASVFRVAVFNPWEGDAARRLKQLNPRVTVLAYVDLASTRSYRGAVVAGRDAKTPTGVGFVEAQSRPGWFATSGGRRVEWAGYPGHWQMAVWDAGYRAAWTRNVVARLGDGPFDGVLADNALGTLSHYTQARLDGGRDDEDVRRGVAALVEQAGRALQARGKLLVPNVGEGRLHDGWWERLTRYGGGFEEQFVHFGEGPDDGYLSEEERDGWSDQVAEVAGPGLVLARTNARPGDDRPFLYGLATFWLAGGGRGAFAATTRDGYDGTQVREEQRWDLGAPLAPARKVDGVWVRAFTRGFVAVNPSATETRPVEVPDGMRTGSSGPLADEVPLGPHSGLVLRAV